MGKGGGKGKGEGRKRKARRGEGGMKRGTREREEERTEGEENSVKMISYSIVSMKKLIIFMYYRHGIHCCHKL